MPVSVLADFINNHDGSYLQKTICTGSFLSTIWETTLYPSLFDNEQIHFQRKEYVYYNHISFTAKNHILITIE